MVEPIYEVEEQGDNNDYDPTTDLLAHAILNYKEGQVPSITDANVDEFGLGAIVAEENPIDYDQRAAEADALLDQHYAGQ